MITSCFYSFQESCIIDGEAENGKLIIHNLNFYENKTVNFIGELLNSTESQVWINRHEPLKAVVTKAKEFDLCGENSDETQALADAWQGLKTSNRVEFVKDSNLKDCEALANCLQILIKALTKELFGKPVENIYSSATIRKLGSRNRNF